jgi:hypothetical protein
LYLFHIKKNKHLDMSLVQMQDIVQKAVGEKEEEIKHEERKR